ncbi:DUF222 domain-containing protein [Gordonia soli]|uniref:DUF222 domain-containing protein n=1 Tax=Gordonia soli NBRC 108243 TaxID=1223545 RepID=M0QIM2_9ACTN|nr:hypothetical protein GS4_07_00360 [Gordonia soli NBRC 108243]
MSAVVSPPGLAPVAAVSVAVSPSSDATLFDGAVVAELSDGELRTRVVGYAGQMAALTARYLELLAEFDRRRAWSGEGIVSCAQWLSWRVGLSLRTAHDHVRVAHALAELPMIAAAFAAGRLTYSKVRALTRVATPERDAELLNLAVNATAAQVERLVRSMRQVDRRSAERENGVVETGVGESSGRWRWDDDGTLSVTLRLNPLDGARFLAGAVRAEYERTRVDGDPEVPPNAPPQDEPVPPRRRDLWRHVPTDIAPAVIAMADTIHDLVDIPETAPGAEILIHTHDDAAAGAAPVIAAHLDDGPALADTDVEEARC